MNIALAKYLRNSIWYESLRRAFWRDPDRLLAAKATIAIGIVSIPFIIWGKAFIGVTLALGALAGALAETDDHPKGRIKALILTIFSFAFSSTSVEILRPYPWLFATGLVASTILFILLGGMGERYRGVTFGAILIAIYTMLGTEISPSWYWQPILLPSGALFYGILSLILTFIEPYRLLKEQLARGFYALSAYLKEKANLFPSTEQEQAAIRNRLALLNIQVVIALERCKDVFNSYADAVNDQAVLAPYLRQFMMLQSLHERAASSHEKYELLSSDPERTSILEGFGQLLLQLSSATKKLAVSILTGVPYKHPVSLSWTVHALHDQLEKYGHHPTLELLLHNLTRSHRNLKHLNSEVQQRLIPRLGRDERSLWERLKSQLSIKHPRLRYAIRLSICFVLGYGLLHVIGLTKGDWVILTALFVCQPSYSETRRRLFHRIMGTFIGVVGGVLIVQLLPTIGGQILLMLSASFIFFLWLKKYYAISVIFITIFVLCAFNFIGGEGVAMMGPRLLDTLIGATLAFLVVRFLWPDWQYKRLPVLLTDAFRKNVKYYQAILLEYKKVEDDDDLNYRIARRQAHLADNALALAWQDMKVEPKKQKQFQQQAFTLTYLNHAMLSYLSALGAHRYGKQPVGTDFESVSRKVEKALLNLSEVFSVNNDKINTEELMQLLELIGKRIGTNESSDEKYFVILYNLTEVALQVVKRA